MVTFLTTHLHLSADHPSNGREKMARQFSSIHNIGKHQVDEKKLLNLVRFKHNGNIKVCHNHNILSEKWAFFYDGMYVPTQLAVLNHNSNIVQTSSYWKEWTVGCQENFSKEFSLEFSIPGFSWEWSTIIGWENLQFMYNNWLFFKCSQTIFKKNFRLALHRFWLNLDPWIKKIWILQQTWNSGPKHFEPLWTAIWGVQ